MCEFLDTVEEIGFQKGIEQGIDRGIEQDIGQGTSNALHNLMESLRISLDEAMRLLKIPADDKELYVNQS